MQAGVAHSRAGASHHATSLLDLILEPHVPDLAALPPILALPLVALGDLPAVLAHSPAPSNEYGQYVDFDADLWRFRPSPIYAGTPHAVLAPDLLRHKPALMERLLLLRRVRAVSWHTHPNPAPALIWPPSCPSLGDLATISLLPIGYRSRLHVVAAAGETDAIVVARPPAGGFPALHWSVRGRPPVRIHRRRVRWLQDVRSRWQNGSAPAPAGPRFAAAYRRFLARAAAEFGLAYYHADGAPLPDRPLILHRVEPAGEGAGTEE
jgi:hypothetical protein